METKHRRAGVSRRSVLKLVPAIALTAAALFLVARALLIGDASTRLIDGRYFLAAAWCVGDGLSPYRIQFFAACWTEALQLPYRAPFVFPPPVLLLYALPMAGFDRVEAGFFMTATGIATWGIVVAAMAAVSARLAGRGPGAPSVALWLFLGSTSAGMLGSLHLGQLGHVEGLGLCLLVLSLLVPRVWRLAVALILLSMKPHLALLPLAFGTIRGAVFQPVAILAFAAVSAASLGLALWLDGSFLADALESLRMHRESRFSGLDGDRPLVGVAGLWQSFGPLGVALVLAGSCAGAILGGRLQAGHDLPRLPVLCAAMAFLGFLLVPTKIYDTAALSPLLCVMAGCRPRLQLLVLPAAVVLWRPEAGAVVGLDAVASSGVAVALLGGVFLGLGWRAPRFAAPTPVV